MSVLLDMMNWQRGMAEYFTYLSRIRKDGGTLAFPELAQKLYDLNRPLESVTKLMWSAVGAISPRVSGVNTFTQKGYDMTPRAKLYGDELVVNGDFSNGSTGWSVNAPTVISDGKANIVSLDGTHHPIQQTLSVVIGNYYLICCDYELVSGVGKIQFGSGSLDYIILSTVGVGRVSQIKKWDGTDGILFMTRNASSTCNCYIDNISIKQVLTNDLTQTTAANQPDFSRIAPVERGGLLNANGQSKYLSFPTIAFRASDAWSVECVLNWNGDGGLVSSLFGSANSALRLRSSSANIFRIVNEASAGFDLNSSEINKIIGKTSLITLVATGRYISLYINGIFISITDSLSFSATTAFNFQYILLGRANYIQGKVPHLAIFSKALSPSEVANRSAVLRSIYPEVDSVPIGSQTWAVRNAEHVCSANGTLIADANVTGTWTTGASGWCNANGDVAQAVFYGKLYNKAARDVIIANPPEGWHVSTEVELTGLAALGGNALKAMGTNYWTTATGTNTTGLTMLGGASRNADGTYATIKGTALFWCADSDKALRLTDNSNVADIVAVTANQGCYIRLVKN